MSRITARLRIYFGNALAIGPGRIELLEGIQRSGSLAQAARDMDMSYRRAWLLMQSLNESLNSPATAAAKGGRHGGGASLTPTGIALIDVYRKMQHRVARDVNKNFARFARSGRATTKVAER